MGPNIGIWVIYIYLKTYTKISITLKQGKIFTQNEDI